MVGENWAKMPIQQKSTTQEVGVGKESQLPVPLSKLNRGCPVPVTDEPVTDEACTYQAL